MARKEVLSYEITDDVDGSPIDPTQPPIVFFDPATGRALAIDLGPGNLEKFNQALDAMAFFVGHAQKASPNSRAEGGKPGARYDRAELMAWAATRGYEVGARGRVPKAIEEDSWLRAESRA